LQEAEKAWRCGWRLLPPHRIATGQLFRWRVQFGLTTRKTLQLATVILTDGAVNRISRA
jgi:hypothetical protein